MIDNTPTIIDIAQSRDSSNLGGSAWVQVGLCQCCNADYTPCLVTDNSDGEYKPINLCLFCIVKGFDEQSKKCESMDLYSVLNRLREIRRETA